MRDLNLGPDTAKLVERFSKLGRGKSSQFGMSELNALASEMARMLERWMDIGWCWHDASPARVCGGPHVRVKYQHDRMGENKRPIEIIEPADKVGETFPDVPYTVIKS